MRQLLYFLLLSVSFIPAKGIAQVPALLNPNTQPRFQNALPIPAVIDARGGGMFTIPVSQFQQDLGLKNPATGKPLLTTVWGYNGTYPGPTIVAKKDVPISVYWPNNLTTGRKPLKHLLLVDESLHWALGDVPNWQTYGIPIVTHLHGGQTEWESDGLPDAWYTPGFSLKGHLFRKGQAEPFYYSNAQEAATIWYHDHALGITRLNVYAGLAGYYIVTDDNETALQNAGKLPSGNYDIGLAIQDRMFTSKGELYYPSGDMASMPSHMPEFFGDFILVNGKIWPVLEVEPRQYRFRLLNGSDSRFYNLTLSSGQMFYQIGSDVGLLPKPVELNRVLIAPGERRDVILDFSATGLQDQTIIMHNDAATPFPDGEAVDPQMSVSKIMAFKVSKKLNDKIPLTTLPNSLRADPIPRLPKPKDVHEVRKLILFEGLDEQGRLMAQLGTVEDGPLAWMDEITENPGLHDTEIWEIYNTTVDAHPVHLHMVKMQLINRQDFTATTGDKNQLTSIQLHGNPTGPEPGEDGWKDTYIAYPGQVTRIVATFNIPGYSVWHCHILSHEDHEMMRPYFIGTIPEDHMGGHVTKVADATPELEKQLQLRMMPNPFNTELKLQLQLSQSSTVSVSIYDVTGRRIQQVFSGRRDAGLQQFTVDGSRWSNGAYFCEIVVDGKRLVRKLTLQK
jgi:spore coat protein A